MTRASFRVGLIGTLGLSTACGSGGGGQALPDAGPPDPFSVTGCAATPAPPVAPGGYYVNGNTICTADGRVHLLHGVDRPSLEWSSGGENVSLADFRLMASWNTNVVRIALNQDFWIAASPLFDPNYAALVDTAVAWAETEGIDVILDLHWSDAGVLGGCVSTPTTGCQQQMPDVNSITFWSEVAARYQDDGRVLFELYNEPHDVPWSVWKSGGAASDGFQAVGMQQLYDAVRATGAENLVLIGGLDWAYDLSGVPANRIDGHNIVYATHPYNTGGRRPNNWDASWGFLTKTDPVIVTEFGNLDDATCATDYSAELIAYADAHAVSWTAWAWFPGGCTFPAIIDDWSATPSPTGQVVKAALLGYGDPPASPPGGRSEGPDLDYTFDRGTEGWILDTYDPDPTNLGADVPDGGSRPTLRFVSADGDPGAGALELTVAFTGLEQYVVANVNFGQPGLDLSGKTLHARVKIVSGSLGVGRVMFGAVSGPSYIVAETPALDAAGLTTGAWVPLTLDLGTTTAVGFDASKIVGIGLRFLASPASSDGGTSDGGSFVSTGNAVFEIDTVTD
jgi:endoglucanase